MRIKILFIGLFGLALTACDNNPSEKVFDITISNITNAQVLTPPAIFLHDTPLKIYELGKPSSAGLEVLAESGSPSDLVTEKEADALATVAGDAPIMPGTSSTYRITVESGMDLALSMASMLAFTNDAFAGVDNYSIGDLDQGDKARIMAVVFDAGTEANSETEATVPALGGAGFEAGREDRDTVVIHPGVVTQADGLATSGLDESRRWLNYGALVTVERIE